MALSNWHCHDNSSILFQIIRVNSRGNFVSFVRMRDLWILASERIEMVFSNGSTQLENKLGDILRKEISSIHF